MNERESIVFPLRTKFFQKMWPHVWQKTYLGAEAKDKIKAAVDARKSEKFLIRARTDAANVDGINAAIDRLVNILNAERIAFLLTQ